MNLSEQQFGRLTAKRLHHVTKSVPYWECVCSCGATSIVSRYDLERGHSRSCGCLMREVARRTIAVASQASLKHGNTSRNGASPEYRSWSSMRQRCNNPQNHRYKDYGARGIQVCERWKEFATFLADMGQRPLGTSLDRVNNDGNYELGNCRWATPKQQQRNGRRVRIVSRNGITGPFRDVCDSLGISYMMVRTRLSRGWDEESAWTLSPQTRLVKTRKKP